jgi:hypothetical protein
VAGNRVSQYTKDASPGHTHNVFDALLVKSAKTVPYFRNTQIIVLFRQAISIYNAVLR